MCGIFMRILANGRDMFTVSFYRKETDIEYIQTTATPETLAAFPSRKVNPSVVVAPQHHQ
jgi:hypothetical protein